MAVCVRSSMPGGAALAAVRRLRKLQALQGGAVQRHEVGTLIGLQRKDVRKGVLLCLRQVGKQRARGANAETIVFQAEAGNIFVKVLLQALGRARVFKRSLVRRPPRAQRAPARRRTAPRCRW